MVERGLLAFEHVGVAVVTYSMGECWLGANSWGLTLDVSQS